MEQADGNVTAAAGLLGIKRDVLRDRIRNNKGLRARWQGGGKKDVKPPSKEIVIHRPSIPEISEEELLALALKKEDDSVRKGLSSMGLNEAESEMSLSCKNFARQHFGSALQLMTGGITKQFVRIMVEIDRIDERLRDRLECPISLQEEGMLREDRRMLLEQMGKFNERVSKSALIQAKIWQIKKASENEKSKEPKGILDLSKPTDV